MTPSFAPALVARIHEILRRSAVPGATIARSVGGEVITWASSDRRGGRDRAGAPLAADARFPIYSITKTFIGAAILRLVADGVLGLDQPAREVLAEVPARRIDPAVTLRQLLDHTSGLPDYGGLAAYHDDLRRDPGAPWSDLRFLEMTLTRGARFAPGEGWAYSNVGFMLLRQVLERAVGGTFGEALERLVITPAGLRDTTVLATPTDLERVTPGFGALADGGEREDVTLRYHPGWVSHGLLASTAHDLARFFDRLMDGDLLPARELAEMCAPVPVPGAHAPFVRPSYGLGVMIDPDSPHGFLVGHGGGGPGFSTAAFHARDPDGRSVTAVALVNRDGTNAAMDLAFALLQNATPTVPSIVG